MSKTSWEVPFPWGRRHGRPLPMGTKLLGDPFPWGRRHGEAPSHGKTSWGGFFPWGRRHGKPVPIGNSAWEARSCRKFCMGSRFPWEILHGDLTVGSYKQLFLTFVPMVHIARFDYTVCSEAKNFLTRLQIGVQTQNCV